MVDLLITLAIIFGGALALAAACLALYLCFVFIVKLARSFVAGTPLNLPPAQPPPSATLAGKTSQAPELALEKSRLRAAGFQAFGLTEEEGHEIRMGWFETIFTLAKPVAGIHKIELIEGRVLFTSDNRCAVISDGQFLTLLDRVLDRYIKLQLTRQQGWFEFSVNGSQVQLIHHPRHGSMEIAATFTFDAHHPTSNELIPIGWPGTSVVFPPPQECLTAEAQSLKQESDEQAT